MKSIRTAASIGRGCQCAARSQRQRCSTSTSSILRSIPENAHKASLPSLRSGQLRQFSAASQRQKDNGKEQQKEDDSAGQQDVSEELRTASRTKPSDHAEVSERTLGIGKTISTLQTHLPTLLISPLPTSILSPAISLHLFPSTHPHLPTVRGRMAYIAALWTAPVAWGRIPGFNVRLEIESERMVGEEFVVRWRVPGGVGRDEDSGEGKGKKGIADIFAILGEGRGGNSDEGFSGMFIFAFDERGRILKHTIEHADRGREGEEGRIISVAEWLMKKARGGIGGIGSVGGLSGVGGGMALGCKGEAGKK